MSADLMEVEETLILAKDPDTSLKEGIMVAKKLKKWLIDSKRGLIVNGKRHIEFTEWQALANWYEVDVETKTCGPVEVFGDKGMKAIGIARHTPTGRVVGKAEAMCFKSEPGKHKQNWNQIASMAQTRAGSKALKNALGWVVELAGISSTPAEEMEGIGRQQKTAPPKPKVDPNQPLDEPETVVDADFKEKKGGKPSGKAKKEKKVIEVSKSALKEIFKISGELKKSFQPVVDGGDPVPRLAVLKKADELYAQDNFELYKEIKGILEGDK